MNAVKMTKIHLLLTIIFLIALFLPAVFVANS